MNDIARCCLSGLCVMCLSVAAIAQEAEEQALKTHTVEKGPFKVEVTVEGVFEAETTHEILLQPDVWSSLKVDEVVAEGTRVRAGDPILKLETDKLDNEIQDQQLALRLSELSLRQTQVDLESLERSVPLDLEDARRSQRIADEDLDYFQRITEGQRKEAAEESLKSSEHNLEYAQEELDQLEQMYKADDLTEQTEEIILKRARRSVERAEYFLDLAKTRYDRSLHTEIPREKQQVEEAAARQKLSLRKAEATLPRSLDKQRVDLEKLDHAHRQLQKKLGQLRSDREQMIVQAPADGFVYYGQADRGKWTTASTLRKQLRPGGTLSANSVVLTVVEDRPGFVRVDVPEKDFRHFKEGTKAVVKPTAFPKTRFAGECGGMAPVAVSEGTFDGRVFYKREADDPKPIVGMTCKVTITPYEKDDAIAVPASAVFGEEGDRSVYLKDAKETKPRAVKTGETADGKIEITEGLAEGDVILLEKPE